MDMDTEMHGSGDHGDAEVAALGERLAAAWVAQDDAWTRVRGELARRAAEEGMVEVAFEIHDSPVGPLVLAATDLGLVRLGLPGEDADRVLDHLAARVSPRVLRAPRASVTAARRQLDEYFARRRREFDLPLDWRLVQGFRREVLRAAMQIPYGSTITYRDIAAQAGRPGAARAAGTALGRNPLPIVVPCHRVLRADHTIGEYLGGTATKAHLLALEGAA